MLADVFQSGMQSIGIGFIMCVVPFMLGLLIQWAFNIIRKA